MSGAIPQIPNMPSRHAQVSYYFTSLPSINDKWITENSSSQELLLPSLYCCYPVSITQNSHKIEYKILGSFLHSLVSLKVTETVIKQPHHFGTWELWSCAASMPSSTEAMSKDIGVPLWSTGPMEQGLRCKVGGSFRPMTASGSSSLRFLPWRRHGCNGTARTRTSHGNLRDESVQHYHVYYSVIY